MRDSEEELVGSSTAWAVSLATHRNLPFRACHLWWYTGIRIPSRQSHQSNQTCRRTKIPGQERRAYVTTRSEPSDAERTKLLRVCHLQGPRRRGDHGILTWCMHF